MPIVSFLHKGLRLLYCEDSDRGVPARSANKLRNMLTFLDAMSHTRELFTPTLKWKAHWLSGDRNGTLALHVTANWRLTFRVDTNGTLCELNLEDYHSPLEGRRGES